MSTKFYEKRDRQAAKDYYDRTLRYFLTQAPWERCPTDLTAIETRGFERGIEHVRKEMETRISEMEKAVHTVCNLADDTWKAKKLRDLLKRITFVHPSQGLEMANQLAFEALRVLDQKSEEEQGE